MEYSSKYEIDGYMGDLDACCLIMSGSGVCECLAPVGRKIAPRAALCLACNKPLDVLASQFQGIGYESEELS